MQSPSEPIMQLQNSSRFSRVCPLNHLVNLALWLCAQTTGQTTVHKTSQNTLHRAIVHINSKWPNVGNDVDIFFVQFQVFFCLIFSLKCRYLHERRERAKTKRENKQSVECDYSRKESNFVCYCLVFSTSVHFCSSVKSKKRLCISII